MKWKFILVSKITPKCKFMIKKIDCLGAFKNMIGIALPSLKSSINMRSGKKNISLSSSLLLFVKNTSHLHRLLRKFSDASR